MKLNKSTILNFMLYGLFAFLIVKQVPVWLNSYQKQDTPLKEFTAVNLQGKGITLPQQGQRHLYVFWTSWCGPCKAQFKILKSFIKDHDDLKNKIIAVNLGEDLPIIKKYAKTNKYPFEFYLAPRSTWSDLKIDATPTLMLVNAQGIIEYTTTGLSPLIVERLKSFLHK